MVVIVFANVTPVCSGLRSLKSGRSLLSEEQPAEQKSGIESATEAARKSVNIRCLVAAQGGYVQ
jgi:hypothetical protein